LESLVKLPQARPVSGQKIMSKYLQSKMHHIYIYHK
jgi:hypothetical protein